VKSENCAAESRVYTILETQTLVKEFKGFVAVDGVSLRVRCGEIHALIGPNGAGKSTTFNLISGYMAPSSGSVLLRGQPISGLPPYQINRRGLSRSFQVTNVFANMSVWENLRCAVLWSSGQRYAIDSHITRAIRDLAPLFEHRLFLSATPHNGHPNSFATLLEILDPQRFTRGIDVEAVRLTGDHVDALVLENGEEVLCGKAVNAAGPAAAHVARMAGIELPVKAEKRSIFVFDCKDGPADMPLIIDPNGVYFRPEGKTFIAGAPATAGIDSTTLDVDYGLFDEIVWPTLANRVPAFEAIKLQGAWAGYYEMNLFDHNAIVGKAPNVENFYLANGFSGHGMQQSPAVGRGMAELLLVGSYEELDLSPLGYDRILANEPIVELNVI